MINQNTKVRGVKIGDLGRWIYQVSEEVHKLNWSEEKTIKYLKVILFSIGLKMPRNASGLTCGYVLKEYEKELRKPCK